MAHWLEGAGLLMMGLAGHGAGFNIALRVDLLG
jgi:8-hydroxy-5-deazaflavin:NADPH oxidoreductase